MSDKDDLRQSITSKNVKRNFLYTEITLLKLSPSQGNYWTVFCHHAHFMWTTSSHAIANIKPDDSLPTMTKCNKFQISLTSSHDDDDNIYEKKHFSSAHNHIKCKS